VSPHARLVWAHGTRDGGGREELRALTPTAVGRGHGAPVRCGVIDTRRRGWTVFATLAAAPRRLGWGRRGPGPCCSSRRSRGDDMAV